MDIRNPTAVSFHGLKGKRATLSLSLSLSFPTFFSSPVTSKSCLSSLCMNCRSHKKKVYAGALHRMYMTKSKRHSAKTYLILQYDLCKKQTILFGILFLFPCFFWMACLPQFGDRTLLLLLLFRSGSICGRRFEACTHVRRTSTAFTGRTYIH